MTVSINHTRTLRLPETVFPMRALASKPRGGGLLPGWEARERDLASLGAAFCGRDVAEEAYRTLRNAFRWMLGSLRWHDGESGQERQPLESYMALEAGELCLKAASALRAGDAAGATRLLARFAADDLLAFYFDVTKDALYCDPSYSPRRRSCLAFMDGLFCDLVRLALPVAPNLAAEAWQSRHGATPTPEGLPEGRAFPGTDFARGWRGVRAVRKAVGECLEAERRRRAFDSFLELSLRLHVCDPELAAGLAASSWDPAMTLCVSQAEVRGGTLPEGCLRPHGLAGFGVTAMKAEGQRCARSRRFCKDVGSDPLFPDLSARDAQAVRERRAQLEG